MSRTEYDFYVYLLASRPAICMSALRTSCVLNAIAREKEIKDWTRAKRVALIEAVNPTWEDLSLRWGTIETWTDPKAER